MQSITVAASKGGVGKTTATACLAVEASRSGGVGLYDADLQRSLARWHELREGTSNIRLISARDPAEAVSVAERQGCATLLIDTPPALLLSIQQAIAVADLVVVPVRPSPIDVEAVDSVIELITRADKPWVMLLTQVVPPVKDKFDGHANGARQYLSSLGRVLDPVLCTRKPYLHAMGLGKVGSEIDDKCAEEVMAVWAAVQQLMPKGARR